jgi:hypothetical protein
MFPEQLWSPAHEPVNELQIFAVVENGPQAIKSTSIALPPPVDWLILKFIVPAAVVLIINQAGFGSLPKQP